MGEINTMWFKAIKTLILTLFLTSQLFAQGMMYKYKLAFKNDYFRTYIYLYSLDSTLHDDILIAEQDFCFEPGFYRHGLYQYNTGWENALASVQEYEKDTEVRAEIETRFLDTETAWVSSQYRGGVMQSSLTYPGRIILSTLNIYTVHKNIVFNINGLTSPQISYKRLGNDTDYLRNLMYYGSNFDSYTYLHHDICIDIGYKFDDVQMFLIYNFLDIEHRMKNLNWFLYQSWYFDDFKVEHLDSKYEIFMHGFGLGLKMQEELLEGLEIDGSVRYLFFTSLENEGTWNLRDLRFEHEASNAERLILKVGLNFNPWKDLWMGLGYYSSNIFGLAKNDYWFEGGETFNYRFPVDFNVDSRGPILTLSYRM